MSETLSSGLTLTIPTLGEQNWDQVIRNQCFLPISEHDHTGSGNGVQLSTNALQNDAVTGAKLRLANNQALRARNAANSADVDLLKLDGSDVIQIGTSASLRLKTDGAQDVTLATNGTDRWEVDGSGSTGHLLPKTNNAYDLGSTSFGVRDAYIAGAINTLPSISYSPTISSNAGSYNGTGTTRYHLIGKQLTVYFNVSGTITGTPNYLTITLPGGLSGFAADQYVPVRITTFGGPADEIGIYGLPSGVSTMRVYRQTGTLWTAGAGATFIGTATFLMA